MPTVTDRAAWLRAAFAYAGLTKKERAEALGVGIRHVTRYESGETTVPTERWAAVVKATGVPRWFIESGFKAQPEPEEPTALERVEALEHQLRTLRTEETEREKDLRKRVAQLNERVLELLEREEARRPSEQGRVARGNEQRLGGQGEN